MYSYCLVVAVFCFFDFFFVLILCFSLSIPFRLWILVRLCRYWIVHSSFRFSVSLSLSNSMWTENRQNKMCGFFFHLVWLHLFAYAYAHFDRTQITSIRLERLLFIFYSKSGRIMKDLCVCVWVRSTKSLLTIQWTFCLRKENNSVNYDTCDSNSTEFVFSFLPLIFLIYSGTVRKCSCAKISIIFVLLV